MAFLSSRISGSFRRLPALVSKVYEVRMQTPLEILRTVFGFDSFIGRQAEVIEHVLAGNDALVLMPTGGGKSLCYQIPSLMRPGMGLVVSPLIALMQDQVRGLVRNGVRAAYLNSALSGPESYEVERAMRSGGLDILFVAPERAVRPGFLELLAQCRLALVAIDEAHCVSQWGHDFRPEYTQLDVLGQRFPDVPRLALTATADGPTKNDIIRHLGFDRAQVFSTGYDRPNIRYHVQPKYDGQSQLLRFIKENHPDESGIVYRLSRKKVDQTAAWLRKKGIRALAYHAGMSADERRANQERFMLEEKMVMVATIAFGMGVDKPNVRFVAHLEPPKSVEAYHQETGRAGRDGLPADAWMAYSLGDVITLRQMIFSGDAHQQRKMVELEKLNALLGMLDAHTCRRQMLLAYFGQDLPEPCGNCDNCLNPPETFDGTIAAQKVLSNIFRTGQGFGAGHLVDVLLGGQTERILNLGHDKVSTYGIGNEHTRKEWQSMHRQLAAQGLLDVDIEGFGVLKLNARSWEILRSQRTVAFRKDQEPAAKGATSSKSRFSSLAEQDAVRTPADESLFEALRALRLQIAGEENVPPYQIFPDRTLLEMVAYRPQQPEQFGQLFGVGRMKFERYTERFLEVIGTHIQDHGLPEGVPPVPQRRELERKNGSNGDGPTPEELITETVRETVRLLRSCHDPQQVAKERCLQENTIYSHACKGLAAGMLRLSDVVSMPDEELERIKEQFCQCGDAYLKPVFDALDGKYSYAVLGCIRASVRQSKA